MNNKKKAVSLQTIADKLNVSKYSVSLALNNRPGIGEELRQRILETAKEMGYHKTRRVSDPPDSNILVIIPKYIQNDTLFYGHIYWVIENEVEKSGRTAILTSLSQEMERELILPHFIKDMDIAGIITVGVLSMPFIRLLAKTQIPIVSVDQSYDFLPIDSVVTANVEGAYQIVCHLIENGHTDIGFVGAINMTSSIFERWIGYQKAMNVHGLRIISEHCITKDSPLSSLLSEAEELEQVMDKMNSLPTAWFCAGGLTALNLMNILKKRNIKIPEQISIVGFDNPDFLSFVTPALTTYNVRRTQLGELAVKRLLEKIADPFGYTTKTSIYGDLIIRDSVKRIDP